MAHARHRGRELRELEERRKKVHLKTIGAWVALAVCVVSFLIAWNQATRLVWLGAMPFAVIAVWVSLRTEKDIDGRMESLAPSAPADSHPGMRSR